MISAKFSSNQLIFVFSSVLISQKIAFKAIFCGINLQKAKNDFTEILYKNHENMILCADSRKIMHFFFFFSPNCNQFHGKSEKLHIFRETISSRKKLPTGHQPQTRQKQRPITGAPRMILPFLRAFSGRLLNTILFLGFFLLIAIILFSKTCNENRSQISWLHN